MKQEFRAEIKKIAKEKNILMREAKLEALARIEERARTVEDFKKLSKEVWDELDANRERRKRYYVSDLEDMTIEDVEVTDGAVVPQPLNHMWWRQMMRGDFLDAIFNCPYDLHELTSSRSISEPVKALSENQKEILFFRAIWQWSPQKIAAMRNQSDRNIRKVYDTLIESLQKKLYERLLPRYDAGLPLTLAQREFVKKRKPKDDNDETEKEVQSDDNQTEL